MAEMAVHTQYLGRPGRPYTRTGCDGRPYTKDTVSVRRSQTGGCRCAGKLSNDSVTVNKRNNNIYFLPD